MNSDSPSPAQLPPTVPATIIDSLPKAELHLHLEGSIRPETAVELARRHGVNVTLDEVAARYSYSNFAGFLDAFKWVTSFLREPGDYRLVFERLADELLRQHVVYAEITLSVGVMLLRRQNVEANLEAIHDLAQSDRFRPLRTAWIVDAVRQFGSEPAMEVARAAAKLQKYGVIGFGMGGDELGLPAQDFQPVFDYARSEGLRLVCHAGEIGGPESVREAVEILQAERIGHGIALMHDPALTELLGSRGIGIENCLSSNLCTGALAAQIGRPHARLADHPLPQFLESGLAVTLSTDDPAMFRTNLNSEYSKAASLGLTNQQLLSLAEQSFTAAFLPPAEKRALLDNFRAAAQSASLL